MKMNQNNTVNDLREDSIQREIEKLDSANRKQEERIRKLETRATQNVNLYFVFQAVVLASTTMASAPNCRRQWWIPFVVSLLAAIPNFFNFWTSMFNVLKEREELDQNLVDAAFIKLNRMTRAQIDQVLPGDVVNQVGNGIVRPKASSAKRWKRRLQVYASMALFVGFTAVIMSGCYTILCHSEDDRKCVKLC